jgi:hypothetical protein
MKRLAFPSVGEWRVTDQISGVDVHFLSLPRISQAFAAAAFPMAFLLRSARIPGFTVCRHTAHPGILRAPCRQCHLAAPRDAILEKCGLGDLVTANQASNRAEDPNDLAHLPTPESD